MSDHRQPIAAFSCRFAGKGGKKTSENCRIEIFPATDFALVWEPTGKNFSPRPPLRDADRVAFWETHYRVRVNGRWLVQGAKYTLLNRNEIVTRFMAF